LIATSSPLGDSSENRPPDTSIDLVSVLKRTRPRSSSEKRSTSSMFEPQPRTPFFVRIRSARISSLVS
jgi:hypothetical protein